MAGGAWVGVDRCCALRVGKGEGGVADAGEGVAGKGARGGWSSCRRRSRRRIGLAEGVLLSPTLSAPPTSMTLTPPVRGLGICFYCRDPCGLVSVPEVHRKRERSGEREGV